MDMLDIDDLISQGKQDAARADAHQAETRRAAGGNSDDYMSLDATSSSSGRERRGDHSTRRGHNTRGSYGAIDSYPAPVRDPRAPNRYSADREENDEIRSRRSKGLDEEVKGGSDKASANGSVHSRDHHETRNRYRSRSPARHDGLRHRDSRDYRSGGVDRWIPGDPFIRDRDGDSRNQDTPDLRPHSRGDIRPGYGYGDDTRSSHDRRGESRRDGYGGRDRRRSPDSRPSHHRGGGGRRSPEPNADERDRRTIFVQQLANRLRTRELEKFFGQVGEVVEAQIVKDRVSGRSKGVGYVEFRHEDSVEKAIGLTGQKLLGIPIIAQLTEAEKNRQAKTEGGATQSNGVPFHRLYVGNIHFNISEDDLKEVFSAFGDLEFAQLQKEEGGRSKGYGFVQFVNPDQAKEALEKMNGFELMGRPIRVGLGNDKFTPESTQNLLQRFGSQPQQAQQGSSFSGMGGRGVYAGGNSNFDKASGGRDADKSGGASALDDTDITGSFSNHDRVSLMKKLNERNRQPEQKVAPQLTPKKAAPVAMDEPKPTRCILLKHMWTDEERLADPADWKTELRDDIFGECNDKYGAVIHVGVGNDGETGDVYVKFKEIDGGVKAYRGLNGRHFAGRLITAQYIVDTIYNVNFPDAKNL